MNYLKKSSLTLRPYLSLSKHSKYTWNSWRSVGISEGLCREGGLRIRTFSLLTVNSAIGLDNLSEWLSELLSINMSANRRHITNDRNGICCCVCSQPATKINVHVNYIVLRREMCILDACYCIVCVCVCGGGPSTPSPHPGASNTCTPVSTQTPTPSLHETHQAIDPG